MDREVSVRDLRNDTAGVVAAVERGERVVLTVNRRPVADIVPHADVHSTWVPSSALRRIVAEAAADPEMLDDIADVRGALIEDVEARHE